ncbi:alpha/beta fold hydrolase [Massilia sp. CCM 8695]|uniref:Alpha/beta fold hydrolase n=1 Tax=Massilia frigida TaxID=2609281 RepID=A0ABX0NIJ1_9BURK|nr:alpha/beta fold hydrolase [Massilia frigida]NHZ83272.1 alpha/beta fold hydrolase [Massilia frigida]
MNGTPWLLRHAGNGRRFRLFCFSYAGGSAAPFLAWQASLPPSIEVCAVQLPGHGARFGEAPFHSLAQLVDALAPVIAREAGLPFAFFGHSLGGLLAFELARHCQRQRLAMPEHLFVSASSAPRQRRTKRHLHGLDDEALIAALGDYNGTPPAILADRELMALLLPAIRADFAMVETYAYRDDAPLDIPITVLAGTNDSHVAAQHLPCWQKETSDVCQLRWFEGDHFFIHNRQQEVIDCILDGLAERQAA